MIVNSLIFDDLSSKVDSYVALVFFLIMTIGMSYLLLRYGRYLYRLELFTLRHIRVRFNRATQQVYIQRPKYCGGIAVFKWQHTIPANLIEDDLMDGSNMVNLIAFHPYKTHFPAMQSVGIGKNTNHAQDYLDEWEFIRRYMEEGPENLPKPKISSLLPIPLHGIEGHLKPMLHFAKTLRNPLVWLIMVPVFLIVLPVSTLGYFLSECLCWQPRWPKIIRHAGKPGAPVPAETTLSDYPKEVQEAILDNNFGGQVLDDVTGEKVDYGDW